MFSLTKVIAHNIRNARTKFTLPELAYNYKALEPIISGEIMEIHHTKHHQAYITNYNAAEEKLKVAVEKGDASAIIALQGALRFNGGGHINHSIFWNNLTPESTKPSAEMNSAIEASFGSFEKMVQLLSAVSVGVQGSGWGWLGYDKNEGKIKAVACANQDPLQATTGLIPLLGIDVWEHAYYLQYRNVRADYVKSIFDVINWNDVSERLRKAKE